MKRGSSLNKKRKWVEVIVKEKPTKKKNKKNKKKLVVNVKPLIFAVRLKKTRKFFKYFANCSEKNLKKFKKKFGEMIKVLNFATPIKNGVRKTELKRKQKVENIAR